MTSIRWSLAWQRVVPGARVYGDPHSISGISSDSRAVLPGDAFVAVRGTRFDGHDYLEAALRAGAAVLVVQRDASEKWSGFRGRVPLVVVEDARAAMGPIGAAIYDHPSRRLALVGVTGTDGKTTTTQLTAHVLSACGLESGYLSSNSFQTGEAEEKNESHMTTVEAPVIQRRLRDAVSNGKRGMVLEASSEGLAQHRLDGCEVDVGVFTNLTRDHLDFHGTMEAYVAAKARLFEMLDLPRTKPYGPVAVVNADDRFRGAIEGHTSARVLRFGLHSQADFTATDIRPDGFDTTFTLVGPGLALGVRSRLAGRFNVYNALAAVAVAYAFGLDASLAADGVGAFPGVTGRLERLDVGQPFQIIIDNASTPAALMTVLEMVRPLAQGRLWVVIGTPGGRDIGRRPGLARAAARYADVSVLTSDDPRDEDPVAIINDMAAALRGMGEVEGRDFVKITDRAEAIRYAITNAAPGDTVFLAGKATETTMLIGGEELPWDEKGAALEALAVAGAR
jgi:UDP-N-acetylmuramoyl-L-alanyl-D-glutamate--2,6-diaminopimelate ligase